MFINRYDAGQRLAELVQKALAAPGIARGSSALVVGLPRGGVPVANVVARAINAPLTILVSKKIGAPFQPEFALGAVSSTGVVVLNDSIAEVLPSLSHYLNNETDRLTRATKELEDRWLHAAGLASRPNFRGKCVVIVDDGVATGMTTLAALRAARAEAPAYLMLATPVIPADTRHGLVEECDAIVAVIAPENFHAIGEFYQDFHQVEDEEVVRSLRLWSQQRTPSFQWTTAKEK